MNSRRDPTRKRKFSMVQTKLFRQLVQKLASRGNSFKLKYALWGTEISECGVMGTRSLREMATSKVSSSTSTNFETEVRDFFWHMGWNSRQDSLQPASIIYLTPWAICGGQQDRCTFHPTSCHHFLPSPDLQSIFEDSLKKRPSAASSSANNSTIPAQDSIFLPSWATFLPGI